MPEPWVRHEDDEVLVVTKPAGLDVRRVGSHGQDGVLDWVERRRPGARLRVLDAVGRDETGPLVLGFGRAPARPADPRWGDPGPATSGGGATGRAIRALAGRQALLDAATDAHLWIDRHHDGFPDVRVERLGDVVLALDYDEHRTSLPEPWVDAWWDAATPRALYRQHRARGGPSGTAALVRGTPTPQTTVEELGLRYLVDLEASTTSTGLFLDQRETRWRLLRSDLKGRRVLNAFAHTGSLSVAAARAGAETLTLDLSRRYLDWARENLRQNEVDPDAHDFVYGDARSWMDRFARRGREFDVVLVDPPSSSTVGTRGGRRWVVERDLHDLVARATRLVAPGGTLFVSTNLRRMRWSRFCDQVSRGLEAAGRVGAVETQTVPLDHRVDPGEVPYLKAAWVSLDGAEPLGPRPHPKTERTAGSAGGSSAPS